MAKALWNGSIIADSKKTLIIEGNHYFPAESVNMNLLVNSNTKTTCPWKGEASYYHIQVGDQINKDAAWTYKQPKEGSEDIVAQQNNGEGDFSDYIAFWNGVTIED